MWYKQWAVKTEQKGIENKNGEMLRGGGNFPEYTLYTLW